MNVAHALRRMAAVLVAGWAALTWPANAHAQTPPKYACTSTTCTFVCDPVVSPRPTQYKLYGSKDGGPTTLLITSNAVAGTAVDPLAPASSVACWLTTKLAAGVWTLTAVAIDGINPDSDPSLPLVIESASAKLPAPTGLRTKTGTVAIP
jgi:hypothetical protein